MTEGNPRLKGSMGGSRPTGSMPQSTTPAPPPPAPPSAVPQSPPSAAYPPSSVGSSPPPVAAAYPSPPSAPAMGTPSMTPAMGYPPAMPAMPGVVTDQRTNTAMTIVAWVFAVGTLFYLLPWAIATTRGKSNAIAIGLLNLLLGWTFIGWVASLVMACGSHNVIGAGGATNITIVQAGFSGVPQAAPGYPAGWGPPQGPAGPAPVDTVAPPTQPTWPPSSYPPSLPR